MPQAGRRRARYPAGRAGALARSTRGRPMSAGDQDGRVRPIGAQRGSFVAGAEPAVLNELKAAFQL